MKELIKQFKTRYTDGQKYAAIMRLIEIFGVALLTGIISMYGTTRTLTGEIKQLNKSVSELVDRVDQHIGNYVIHIPHK
jgi:hypothetical protein